jgi:hypothetical protein
MFNTLSNDYIDSDYQILKKTSIIMKNIKCTKDPESNFFTDNNKNETEENLSYP